MEVFEFTLVTYYISKKKTKRNLMMFNYKETHEYILIKLYSIVPELAYYNDNTNRIEYNIIHIH